MFRTLSSLCLVVDLPARASTPSKGGSSGGKGTAGRALGTASSPSLARDKSEKNDHMSGSLVPCHLPGKAGGLTYKPSEMRPRLPPAHPRAAAVDASTDRPSHLRRPRGSHTASRADGRRADEHATLAAVYNGLPRLPLNEEAAAERGCRTRHQLQKTQRLRDGMPSPLAG